MARNGSNAGAVGTMFPPAAKMLKCGPRVAAIRIQRRRMQIRPPARIQASDKVAESGDGLGRSEGAMACTMDEGFTQQAAVAGFVDRVAIGVLVFIGDESVALGVHCQHRNMNVAVEDDVLFQDSSTDAGLALMRAALFRASRSASGSGQRRHTGQLPQPCWLIFRTAYGSQPRCSRRDCHRRGLRVRRGKGKRTGSQR